MTDKYEEFKEWFKRKSHRYGVWKIDDNGNQEICHYSRAFIDFEEEQSKKEKEEEIKMIISRIMYCESYYYISIGQQEKVSEIYDELKEKDLIK